MPDGANIGIRYCGGCNPRYDRVSLVNRLKGFFPQQNFVSAQPAVVYSAVLVVCGCSNRCANVADLAVPANRLIYLNGWDDLLGARDRLSEMLRHREIRSLDHSEVLAMLPHRAPMLLIDRVSRLVPGVEIIASFYVDPELPALAGHFPENPMLPGVYTAEAAAQAADILLLSTERYAGKLPILMGIRKANFRKMIRPGDTLEIHASLLEEREEMGIAECRGQIFTHGEIAADMEVRLAMR